MKPLALILALSLTGCASTGDYAAYANGQAAIEAAKHGAGGFATSNGSALRIKKGSTKGLSSYTHPLENNRLFWLP